MAQKAVKERIEIIDLKTVQAENQGVQNHSHHAAEVTSYDYFLFFVRLFYPSFYFDVYEQIVENNCDEQKILDAIEKTPLYEKLIKDVYAYLSNYINIPDIEWIKKI